METVLSVAARVVHVLLEWSICLLVLLTRLGRKMRAGRRDASIDVAAVRACGAMPHLAAVVPNGQADLDSIAFLCALMLASRAEWVTVYQKRGSLEKEAAELRRRIEGQWGVPASSRLHIISEKESAQGLVSGVQSVVRDVCEGKLAVDAVNVGEISRHLPYQCPDASLVLCFDGPRRNSFLPWNIRVSTFANGGDLDLLRQRDFVSMLNRYAKVEQRFGA